MRTVLFLLLSLVFTIGVEADRSFWLKNTDSKVFDYWTVTGSVTGRSVLGRLSLTPVHLVGPGERVLVTLPASANLVGVFVPWNDSPTLTMVLEGGVLLESELPEQGTVLVDAPSFAAANRGRSITATLQEWGLEPPRFVLDGQSGDWTAVPLLLEWGPLFTPPEGWPSGWPRPRTLQATDREGALWLRLTMETKAPPTGAQGSLVLRRPGARLEWPLAGTTVWLWDDAGRARAIGSRVLGVGVLEAWIPWDRLSAAEKTAWSRSPSTWQWVTSKGSTSTLGSLRWEDLP